MRKYFIDNIRWMIIMTLFFFHSIMIYNGLGLDYYILRNPSPAASLYMITFSPWFMPLLFLLAGCSTRYSLKKRTLGQYVKERFSKLLLPLTGGIVLLVPILAYIGNCYQNGFTGSYLQEYMIFFTGTGYTENNGGFTVGYLWFIAYLFVISFLTLPVIWYGRTRQVSFGLERIPFWGLAALVIPYMVFSQLGPFPIDKSPCSVVFLYFLGYFCISEDGVQEELRKHRRLLLGITLLWYLGILGAFFTGNITGWITNWLLGGFSWFAMLSAVGWGMQLLNFTHPVCKYFSSGSYGIYFFHMPWVIGLSYILIIRGASPAVHLLTVIPGSMICTIVTYEMVRRIPGLRWVFAIRPPVKSKTGKNGRG